MENQRNCLGVYQFVSLVLFAKSLSLRVELEYWTQFPIDSKILEHDEIRFYAASDR